MGKKLKNVDSKNYKNSIKIINEELKKSYGKINRQVSSSASIVPGVADTPAQKAARGYDMVSKVDYKKTVPPTGRPTGERVSIDKYRAKQGVKDAPKQFKKTNKKK